jgi:hypothetical protein
MASVNISVDVGPLVQWLTDLQTQQVPFATAKAISDLGVEVQEAIRDGERERFTIRRDWVLKGVKIPKFPTKRDDPISITVMMSPDRDFMNKFEQGGTKLPRVRGNIAMPTTALKSRKGIVPDAMRPRNLQLRDSTTRGGKIQTKGLQRTFLLANGRAPGIYQRTGSQKGAIRMLYKFYSSVPIPASLRFNATASKVVNARFRELFRVRLAQALATAR